MNASTPTQSLLSRRSLLAGAAASVAASLLGCGGGDGLAGVGTGGTGSFSSGPIRGFGSIVVNGVRYDEASAQVVQLQLRLRQAFRPWLLLHLTIQHRQQLRRPCECPVAQVLQDML